ncbi:Uncharacterized protein PCOAH_00049040 [Plasmodium coatneyi]|uniref:NTF2 domain-containing protein n=1 Tax=Plasmodium coatneyi TaxID=208452 RepID=A0A1B1E6E8_9APIC|nr:Uncharacterized protein PCOAH_00049040 [Plasmodium coatneyi]ANQ10530.1 Uncharacterized protein PCOAH_00049040 [Plasmodium coatneyi]
MNYRGTDTKQHNKSKNKFPLFFYKNKYSSAKQCLGQGSGPVNPQGGQNTQGSHSNQGPHHVGDNVCNVFQGSTTNNPGNLNNNSNMYYKRRSNFSGAGMVPPNSASGTDPKNSSTMMSYNDDIYHFEKQKLLNGGTTGGMNAYHVDAAHGNNTSGSINNGAGNQGNAHPGSSHHGNSHQGKFYNKNTYNVHPKKEGRQNYENYLSSMHDGTNNNSHAEVTHGNRNYKNYNYDSNRENYVNVGGPKNVNRYYDVGDGTSCMNMSGQKKVNYFDANMGNSTGGSYNHGATHGTTHTGVHTNAHSGNREAGGQDPYNANDQLRREPPRGKNTLQNPSVLSNQKKEPMLIMINGERNNNNSNNSNDVSKVGMKVVKEDHAKRGDDYEEDENDDVEDDDGNDEEEEVDMSFRKNAPNVGTTRGSSNHRDAYNNAKEVNFTKNDAQKGVNTPIDGVTNAETIKRPQVSNPNNHLTDVKNKNLDPTTGSAYNIAYMFIYQYYYVLHTKKAMMHNFYAENAVLLLSFNYQNGLLNKAGGEGGSPHQDSPTNQQSDADKFFNLSQINVEGCEKSGNTIKMKNKKTIAEYYDQLEINECTVHINSIEVINLHEEIYLYIHGKIKKNKSTNVFYYFVQNIHLHKYTVCQYYVDVDFVHYYYLDVADQQLHQQLDQQLEESSQVSMVGKAITGSHALDVKGKDDGTKKKAKVSKLNATLGEKTGIIPKMGENGLKKGAVKKTDVEPVLTSTQKSKAKASTIKGQLDEGNYPPGHAAYGTGTKQSVLTSSVMNKSTEGKNHLAKYPHSKPGDGFHHEDDEEVDYLDVGEEDDMEEDDEEQQDLERFEEDLEEAEMETEADAEMAQLNRGSERGAKKGAYSKKDEAALLKRTQGLGKPVKKVTGQHDPESIGTDATLKKSNKLKKEEEDVHTTNSNANGVGNTQTQATNDGSAKKEGAKEKADITAAATTRAGMSIGKEAEEKDDVTSKPDATTDEKKMKKNKSDGSNNAWKVDSEEKCPKMETILKEEKTLNENGKKKKKEKEKSSKVDPNSWVFRVMKNNTGANSAENGTPAGASQKVQEGAKHADGEKHAQEEKPTEEGETDVETQEEETEEHEINANDKKIIIHNIHKNMDKKKIHDCIIDRLKNYNDGHAVQVDIYQRSAKKSFSSWFSSLSYDKGKAPENYSYAIAELDCRQSQKLLLDLGLYCNGIKLSIEHFKEKKKTPDTAKRNNRKFNGFGGGAPLDASKGKDDRYKNSIRGSSATVATVGVAQFRSKKNNIFVK